VTDLLTRTRWTVDDLDALPDEEGVHYEIIDGELYMTHSPHFEHDAVAGNIHAELRAWSLVSKLGRSSPGAGLVLDPINAVEPDAVWISHARFQAGLDAAGHLTLAPELAVEVLSPGRDNEQRDREEKLAFYSRWGVEEYWIVNWRTQTVEVYRRDGGTLRLAATLGAGDELKSPLLPGFACPVARLFV
jgi:Uma2 family endonuclease